MVPLQIRRKRKAVVSPTTAFSFRDLKKGTPVGSLGKKLRRKKYNKVKKKLIRSFKKLTPEQREEKIVKVQKVLDYIDYRIDGGKRVMTEGRAKPVTPESVIDDIDFLFKEEEADEKDRKADTD